MIAQARFRRIVEEHKNRIYGYAASILRNEADAADVTQEVFIRLWKHLDDVELGRAKAWLMRTTHNLSIDFIRKRKTAVGSTVSLEEMELREKLLCSNLDPFQHAHCRELGEELQAAVEALPEVQRKILLMFELNHCSQKEISELLQIPVNTVKVYLHRARHSLQRQLTEKHHESIEQSA